MSAEKINSKKNILTATMTPEDSEEQHSGRVDINVLINRVREEKQKKSKTNMVFLALMVCLIVIMGTIISF
jgi:hypothetical protein